MIGLSLTACIKDIVEKDIPLADVSVIITSTSYLSPSDWIRGISHHIAEHGAWHEHPVECISVLSELKDAGKIRQPRTAGANYPDLVDGEIWVRFTCEIHWTD